MSIPAFPPLPVLVPELLTWLRDAQRDLPWRRRRDPYAVWVSEIMLQQTQVATVVPYFERWLARFPNLASLAAAPLDEVLKVWQGLGYYARARNLRRAAQQVLAHHNGALPADRAALLALPGIGRYTAGAILSLAFGQREPVLDGNVRRVLCRVYDVAEDPRETVTEHRLWAIAAALVTAAPEGAAGDLNEALMELGALVCVPGLPDCATCPIAAYCLAHARGVEDERPVKRPTPRTPHYDTVAAVVRNAEGRYLLIRRPETGLLGGLWGFPGGALEDGETFVASLARTVAAQTGVEITGGARLIRIKHAYTHFRITLHAFECAAIAGEPRPLGCAAVRWVTLDELKEYALPVTDAKIAAALRANTPPAPALPRETAL